MKPQFDLCVIGGGAAGLVAAAGAATLGAKVALIEKNKLGGDCLYYGCVPSKSLIASAKTAHTLRTAEKFGLNIPPLFGIDLATVMRRVEHVINTIQPNDDPARFRGLGIEVIFGESSFTSSKTIRVNDKELSARRFVIATGSRPAIPVINGLDQISYLTNETVFDIRENIPILAILGGGPIGVELAQAFARLGTQVHVIVRGDRILSAEDADIAAVVQQQLASEGVNFHFNAKIEKIGKHQELIQIDLGLKNGRQTLKASHFLIAAGRQSNIENLGLDFAGVQINKDGVITDERLRTTAKNIYACGDVVGPYRFTHMAEHQAGVVLRNALFHLPAKMAKRAIPWCTFCDPECARVGLSEEQLKKQGIAHEVYRFPFHDIDRAQAEGSTIGMAKILTDRKGKLLGAAIVGPQAGELIHEYVLAIAKGMKTADLSGIIHIYPTLAQINRRVADMRLKQSFAPAKKKWMQRIFGLRGL